MSRYIDPDMGELNNMSPEDVHKVWEACKPKLTGISGTVLVYGTSGSTANFKDIFYE